MYTLDRLGYRGYYDVYDLPRLTGTPTTSSAVERTCRSATGYALIIHDDGRGLMSPCRTESNIDNEKINQAQWYPRLPGAGAHQQLPAIANALAHR